MKHTGSDSPALPRPAAGPEPRSPCPGFPGAGLAGLATPRTLGPFRDLVGSVGAELSRAVTDGHDRDRLLSALRAELDWPAHPAVLVIEDVHWAACRRCSCSPTGTTS